MLNCVVRSANSAARTIPAAPPLPPSPLPRNRGLHSFKLELHLSNSRTHS